MIVCTVTPDGYVQLPDEVLSVLSFVKGQSAQKITFEVDSANKTITICVPNQSARRLLGKIGQTGNPQQPVTENLQEANPQQQSPSIHEKKAPMINKPELGRGRVRNTSIPIRPGTRGAVHPTTQPHQAPSQQAPNQPPPHRDSRTRFL